MATVLRFTYSGTNTDFSNDEVLNLQVSNVQKIYLWQDLQEYFHLNKIGKSFKRISVNFNVTSLNTITKIETLWGYKDSYYQPNLIQMYYEYAVSTSTNIFVRMKRDDYKLNYEFGQVEYGQVIPIIFYEGKHTEVGGIDVSSDLGA